MGIKTYQEKNTKPIEKELAQSDLPVRRKIQKKHPKILFFITVTLLILMILRTFSSNLVIKEDDIFSNVKVFSLYNVTFSQPPKTSFITSGCA